MYCITAHATPDPEKEIAAEARDSAGAYVVCWIDFPDLEGAKALCRFYIEGAGWLQGEIESEKVVTLEDYSEEAEQEISYFHQAVADGYCLSFYLYPPDDEGEQA